MKLWTNVQRKCPDLYLSNVPFSDTGTYYSDKDDPVWEKEDLLLVNYSGISIEKGLKRLVLQERPLCIGMTFRHSLAGKDILHMNDLDGQSIILVKKGLSEYIDQVREYILENCPDVRIIDSHVYDVDTFNRCVDDNLLILTIQEWQDIHPSMITIPVDWNFSLPYGLLYKEDSSLAVERFVSEIKSVLNT